ncbi:MAG: GDP-L-fucose synthase [Bacteroidales bacterium]|jgi:GDP-L-fucose synthase|nr:GDP-L-fucose synthase [Bacteroidales bacterium]
MKILITGSRGMVGKNISNFLSANNFKLLTPSSVELNLLNRDAVDKYIKLNSPDFVIHCAGIVGGIQANIDNPVKFLVNNTQIGINIIMSCYANGVKNFINMGSSCMYPRNAKNPLKENAILSGELEPTNEGYAIAKINSTKLCEYINRENSNCRYKTIIPCNLYGKYDKFDLMNGHMIPAVINKIHEAKINNKESVSIWGNGHARREFMYVEDLADFTMYAINNFSKMPQNINVGLGYDYSINEYYKIIADVIGYHGIFTYDTSKPIGMKQKLIDDTELKKFGWCSKFNIKLGIKITYDYYLNEVIK